MSKEGGIRSIALDIRYGLRMLRKSPAFALIAILTLGLGIMSYGASFPVWQAKLIASGTGERMQESDTLIAMDAREE
jgi:hypothetical protein